MFTGEILHDIRGESNEPVTWKQHRLVTLRLAQAYRRINSPKAHRVLQCGSSLVFRRYKDNNMKLHASNFCQTRLCPMCCWRRSKRNFARVSKIMDAISCDYEFLFLTLTCKNVSADSLSSQIDKMYSAYKALCLRTKFKNAVHGWCRSFETTFNWKTSEYHPHFHVVLAVDKNYFTNSSYIEQKEWALLWQSCLETDYLPIVDIRVLRESEKGKGKEVAEIVKYCVKPTSVMADLRETVAYSEEIQTEVRRYTDVITDSTVYTLDTALANRRLIGFGGIFKTIHKDLNLSSDDDLIHATNGDDEPEKNKSYDIERYRWHRGYKNYLRLDD